MNPDWLLSLQSKVYEYSCIPSLRSIVRDQWRHETLCPHFRWCRYYIARVLLEIDCPWPMTSWHAHLKMNPDWLLSLQSRVPWLAVKFTIQSLWIFMYPFFKIDCPWPMTPWNSLSPLQMMPLLYCTCSSWNRLSMTNDVMARTFKNEPWLAVKFTIQSLW